MNVRKVTLVLATIFIALVFMADDDCSGDTRTNADKKQDDMQETLANEAQRQVGMPGITNFTERKIVRKLYELRDQEIATFTYIPDLNGRLWHLCDSIGYGLPYGVQFTNPHRPLHPNFSSSSMQDQPEPNALFMPSTAEGTWVICGTKTDLKPVYVEPRVIVSPFKLNAAGEYYK
jgi:hypothetical protein